MTHKRVSNGNNPHRSLRGRQRYSWRSNPDILWCYADCFYTEYAGNPKQLTYVPLFGSDIIDLGFPKQTPIEQRCKVYSLQIWCLPYLLLHGSLQQHQNEVGSIRAGYIIEDIKVWARRNRLEVNVKELTMAQHFLQTEIGSIPISVWKPLLDNATQQP